MWCFACKHAAAALNQAGAGPVLTASIPVWFWLDYTITVPWTWWRFKSLVTRLVVQQIVQATRKTSHYRPFVRGIHRSSVDSPHKGPVKLNAFPCHDVIILYAVYVVPYNQTWLSLQHENLSKHDRDLYHVKLLIHTCTCTGTCPYWQLQLIANKMACV